MTANVWSFFDIHSFVLNVNFVQPKCLFLYWFLLLAPPFTFIKFIYLSHIFQHIYFNFMLSMYQWYAIINIFILFVYIYLIYFSIYTYTYINIYFVYPIRIEKCAMWQITHIIILYKFLVFYLYILVCIFM